MAYPENIDRFSEKLNKKIHGVYEIEEKLEVINGVFEGYLTHDNVDKIRVFTGPNKTGQEIVNFVASKSEETPWKTWLRVTTDAPFIYVSYETPGDTVEADDINEVQNSIVRTQGELERCKKNVRDHVENEEIHREINDEGTSEIDVWSAAKILTELAKVGGGGGGPRTVRFVVGTSTAGWTLDDCDYLCDGIDDHVEIQQALDALPDDGGEVKLLDGTYYFEDGVTLTKDRTTLRGSGNSTKIILGEAVQSVKEVRIISLPKNYCTVADIFVDGNFQWAYSVREVYVEGNNNTITGNTCNNGSVGIYVGGSNNITAGNTCNNNYSSGIYVVGGSNNTITGNACNNNYSSGIFVGGSNNTITGNTCNNGSVGIYVDGSNSTITGNTCNNNYIVGIYVSGSNNTITGNTCNNGSVGIYVGGHGSNLPSFNLIALNNCVGSGPVNIDDAGEGNSIYGNKYDEGNDLP